MRKILFAFFSIWLHTVINKIPVSWNMILPNVLSGRFSVVTAHWESKPTPTYEGFCKAVFWPAIVISTTEVKLNWNAPIVARQPLFVRQQHCARTSQWQVRIASRIWIEFPNSLQISYKKNKTLAPLKSDPTSLNIGIEPFKNEIYTLVLHLKCPSQHSC